MNQLTSLEVKELAEQARIFTARDDRQLLMALQEFSNLVIAKHQEDDFNHISAQCTEQEVTKGIIGMMAHTSAMAEIVNNVNNPDVLLTRATRE